MKATFTPNGGAAIRIPKAQLSQASVSPPGWACACGATSVAGAGKRIANSETYEADAVCGGCNGHIGVLRVVVDTLFGIEEDERVLNGPWRVY